MHAQAASNTGPPQNEGDACIWQMLRDKSDTPSNFTLKLRKHLRTRRLDDVRQLGVDRLVDFSFGSGPNCHHLLLELYAQVCCNCR